MPFGLLPTGFVRKTLTDILSDLRAKSAGLIDPQLESDITDLYGNMNGIVGSALTELWEQLEELNAQDDPDGAQGPGLRNQGALLGLQWGEASRSRVLQTIVADVGTFIPAGSAVSRSGQENIRFLLENDFLAATGTTTGVECFAETTGPTRAPAGTLTIIANPVMGWTSTINPIEATLGQDIQSPESFRKALKAEASIRGGSTVDAIRADILALNNQLEGFPILDAIVVENTRNVRDANGIPAKSFEAMIFDGSIVNNNLIAQTIWDSKSAGIYSYGNQVGIAIDKRGDSHSVRFSRPVAQQIQVEYVLAVDSTFSGTAAFKISVSNATNLRFSVGEDVIYKWLEAAAFQVQGVKDVLNCRACIVGGTYDTRNIPISARQRAHLSNLDMFVTTFVYEDV